MSIAADLIRGHTETIILSQLLLHDSYGYEINKAIRRISDGKYELKEATLYTAFRRLEETGLIVRPLRQFLTMKEYYEEYCYISHYFVCEVTGSGQMRLTDTEKRRGLEPQWIPLQEAVKLFSHHQDYADTSEEKRGSYLREYTALREYLATQT